MMFARHSIAKLVGSALAVAGLGLTTAGSAVADATDDAFIFKLAADALNFGARNDVLARAHAVCASFSAGMSPERINATMVENIQSLTPRASALFMAEAVQAYCPRYANLFIS